LDTDFHCFVFSNRDSRFSCRFAATSRHTSTFFSFDELWPPFLSPWPLSQFHPLCAPMPPLFPYHFACLRSLRQFPGENLRSPFIFEGWEIDATTKNEVL
jgi:hypothetical protein